MIKFALLYVLKRGFLDGRPGFTYALLQSIYEAFFVLKVQGLEQITLTTNGVLLAEMAEDLMASGVRRINVSLDSIKHDRYARITRRDMFHRVWEGLSVA